MGDEKHRHETPPGYLGEQPEPADPHDHGTSRPAWRPGEPWISPGIEDVLPASALAPARRWHEIATEGLPADDVDVLVFGWADSVGEPFTVIAQHDSRRLSFEDDDYRTILGVTHWMPLPSPPVVR